jgi:hypothetical protein
MASIEATTACVVPHRAPIAFQTTMEQQMMLMLMKIMLVTNLQNQQDHHQTIQKTFFLLIQSRGPELWRAFVPHSTCCKQQWPVIGQFGATRDRNKRLANDHSQQKHDLRNQCESPNDKLSGPISNRDVMYQRQRNHHHCRKDHHGTGVTVGASRSTYEIRSAARASLVACCASLAPLSPCWGTNVNHPNDKLLKCQERQTRRRASHIKDHH